MINDADLALGYAVGRYSTNAVTIIKKIQDIVQNLMHVKFPNSTELPLDRYHEITGLDDATHEDFHFEATKVLHSEGLVRRLMDSLKLDLIPILGPDIDIQRYPHLRVTRPFSKSDNLGLHRDIDYGASIYEISIWTPLLELNYPGVGMLILPKSNTLGYSGLNLIESDTGITPGSKKNLSGHLYKEKTVLLSDKQREQLVEPVIKLGQYLIIPQATVHGSELNTSQGTRFSLDIRFCNSLIQDDKSTLSKRRNSSSVYGDDSYYTSFTRSQTQLNAQKFLIASNKSSVK